MKEMRMLEVPKTDELNMSSFVLAAQCPDSNAPEYVPKLLGHSDVGLGMIGTYVVSRGNRGVTNPTDDLWGRSQFALCRNHIGC